LAATALDGCVYHLTLSRHQLESVSEDSNSAGEKGGTSPATRSQQSPLEQPHDKSRLKVDEPRIAVPLLRDVSPSDHSLHSVAE